MQLTKHWAGQLDDYAIDLAWSPDGTQLAAASAAGPLTLFAAADGSRRHELPGHENGTNCLAWQPQLQTPNPKLPTLPPSLATAGQDGAVKFWDASAGQHTATAHLGPAWVDHLCWFTPTSTPNSKPQTPNSPSSETQNPELKTQNPPSPPPLLAAASGRALTALRPDASIAHTFKPAPKTIAALAASPRGGSLAAAYFGGVVLWDSDDFIAQKELPYANGIAALVWSPDAKWLVSGNQDPSVHLWIPEQDIELHMSGYESKVKHLSFDHTSRWLATSGGRDSCIWDCSGAGPEGREPAMLPHDAPVCAVKFQNAHGLLATAAQDGTVQLWSPERAKPLRATVKMPSPATRLAWSPDDGYLAIGTEKGHIFVLKSTA